MDPIKDHEVEDWHDAQGSIFHVLVIDVDVTAEDVGIQLRFMDGCLKGRFIEVAYIREEE